MGELVLEDTVICANGDGNAQIQVSGPVTHVGETLVHPDCNNCYEPGDLNGDGCVDGADLGLLLSLGPICS